MSPRRESNSSDDPRKLRELLTRTQHTANEHDVTCVVVGVAGVEGDLLFPELVAFVESTLRIEDAIFRMTRERVVLFLADIDVKQSEAVLERIFSDFAQDFPASSMPVVDLAYYEIEPNDKGGARVKDVLPSIFTQSRPQARGQLH
ncbi:MAG: hypothetical protein JRC77_07345 [Deltaproteobacteria bacterium]|nr:hypothetical protein [Deltaproteobacteria bacterium]